MRIRSRVLSVALAYATVALGACSSSAGTDLTGVDAAAPSLKADPLPPSASNLTGTFTSNRTRYAWSDGVTPGGWMDKWTVMKLTQNNASLKGNAQGYAQYYYADGTVRTGALSTGGGIKVDGSTDGVTATLAWDGRAEAKIITSYVFAVAADGRTLTNLNPSNTLASFTR